jgi:23S rRNA (cytidine1920-2'-O)/16S rRNA (cytidine1409-2'-O)-methyltransferase
LPAPKPASLVAPADSIALAAGSPRYAGRGGLKLEGAFRDFPVAVAGRRALDAGASTGGFTDFLLQHGVAAVVAVDVGYGQLDPKVAADPRVTVLDRTNIRHLDCETAGGPFDLIVGDLSFISICTVAPALAALAADGADLVLLVKPQFEVGKGKVGKGGIVTDPALWHAAIAKVADCLGDHGCGVQAITTSPITGAKGNKEFFVWARRGRPSCDVEVPE